MTAPIAMPAVPVAPELHDLGILLARRIDRRPGIVAHIERERGAGYARRQDDRADGRQRADRTKASKKVSPGRRSLSAPERCQAENCTNRSKHDHCPFVFPSHGLRR